MLLLAAQAASVTIRAVDGDSGEPIFARVALRDEPGALGGCFPPDIVGRIRARARAVVIDAELESGDH
jgi:hypothetical protein